MTPARPFGIVVEISDRRLPARMVARRIRADMREVAPAARPRLRAARGSLATAIGITLIAMLTPTRLRHAG